jgi:DNA repair exonuclease SbcCD ATPase subunit
MDPAALKETLRELSDLLPAVPAGLAALAVEADALAVETAAFLETMQARQVEAAEVVTRVEAAIGALRAASAAQVAAFGERPTAALDAAALAFRGSVAEPVAERLRRADDARAELEAGTARLRDEHATALEAEAAAVEQAAETAGQHLGAAAEQSLVSASTLRATAAELRRAVGEAAERLAATLDAESARGARDLDELARDLGALEATLFAALQHTGDLMHADAERVHEETARRLEALGAAVERAAEDAAASLRDLQGFLHAADGDTTEARQALEPRFEELESRLAPLRQAVESVRDAAASVGLPF